MLYGNFSALQQRTQKVSDSAATPIKSDEGSTENKERIREKQKIINSVGN